MSTAAWNSALLSILRGESGAYASERDFTGPSPVPLGSIAANVVNATATSDAQTSTARPRTIRTNAMSPNPINPTHHRLF
jgi:hypothetical protein